MYNDLVYLISPRSAHTGSAALTMAEFNDGYLDGQWANGAGTPTFKYELIYYPTTTTTGGPEGLKIPQPDDVLPVSIGQIGNGTSLTYPAATPPDKEPYRWNFLIGNGRSDDDYNRLIDFNTVFRQNGATYLNNLPKVIDVDQWLRGFAALSLAGVGDHYSSAGGGWHNLKLYQRADGRILMLPWDHDFLSEPFDAPIVRAPDLSKMISASPAWHRAQGKDPSRIVLDTLARHGYTERGDNVFLQCFDDLELKRIRGELGCDLKLIQLVGENAWQEAATDYDRLRSPDLLVPGMELTLP